MRTKERTHKYTMMFIGAIVSLLWIYPFYLVFVNSIKTKSGIFKGTLGLPTEPTLENYPVALGELDFLLTFFNSVVVTGVSILIIVLFTSMAAYALSRKPGKSSTAIYFLFAICMLIPFQSIMIPLVSLFGGCGDVESNGSSDYVFRVRLKHGGISLCRCNEKYPESFR